MPVTPTYAWRIPRVVRDWLLRTELRGAKRAWFVMTCGSEIGHAERSTCALCRKKGIVCMGTAGIAMPENDIAMFDAPQADEAREIVARAEPDIDRAIAALKAGQPFAPTRNNLYDRFDERAGEPAVLYLLREGERLRRRGRLHRLRPLRGALPDEQHHPAGRQTRLGQGLHPLHGLHLLLSHIGD